MLEIEILETAGFKPAIYGIRNSYKSHERSSQAADQDLMEKLIKAGPEHRKFLRMMMAWVNIRAPFYWLKQLDAYKIGITQNSESTMHTLLRDGLSLEDFSYEDSRTCQRLKQIIKDINIDCYLYQHADSEEEKKEIERRVFALLPSGFMQKRTVCFNYETLRNIYQQRKNHKLAEWQEFCRAIEDLPFSELITM